ncbi:hypothetical protein Ancab_002094 [Ancistrocladus abbreviatus]
MPIVVCKDAQALQILLVVCDKHFVFVLVQVCRCVMLFFLYFFHYYIWSVISMVCLWFINILTLLGIFSFLSQFDVFLSCVLPKEFEPTVCNLAPILWCKAHYI